MKKVLITALVVLSLVLAVSCSTNYTVKFEANGGTPAPAAQTVAAGGVVVEPVSPAKTGYTFTGWYTDSTCATKYNFATKVNSSFTLYAGYNKDSAKTFTVTFNSNGGSEVASQTVKEGECATRPYPDPVKVGYEFVDWYTALGLEAGVAYSFTEKVESDLTLIAKWVDEAGAIIVTFETNGGTPVPGKQGSDAAFYVIYPTEPYIVGCDFIGWYSDAGLTTPFAFTNGKSAVKVTESMKLYAAYKDSGEFSINNGVLTAVNVKGPNATADDPDYEGVKSITLPVGIKSVADAVYVPEGAGYDDEYNYYSWDEHYEGVFSKYPNLNAIVIPSSLEYVGSYAFNNCDLSAVIGEGTKIVASSTELVIPYVKKVGVGAFGGLDKNIKGVVFKDLEVLSCNPFECYVCNMDGRDYKYTVEFANVESLECPALLIVDDGVDSDDPRVYVDLSGCSSLLSFYFPKFTSDEQFVDDLVGNPNSNLFVSKDVEFNSNKGVPAISGFCVPFDVHTSSKDVIRMATDGMLLAKTEEELLNATAVQGATVGLDGDVILTSDIPVDTYGVVFDFNGHVLNCGLYEAYLYVDEGDLTVSVRTADELRTALNFDGAYILIGNNIDVKVTDSGDDGRSDDYLVIDGKNLTIDLNGYTISSNGVIFDVMNTDDTDDVFVTFKNGTMQKKSYESGDLLDHNFFIAEANVNCYNMKFVDDAGSNDALASGYYVIQTFESGNTVNLENCTVELKKIGVPTGDPLDDTVCCAVICNGSTLNMTNCSVTSVKNGIALWTGGDALNIYGDTSCTVGSDFRSIYIYDNGSDKGDSSLNVYGGEFDGLVEDGGDPMGKLVLMGGIFKNSGYASDDATQAAAFTAMVPNGYIATYTGKGAGTVWTVRMSF